MSGTFLLLLFDPFRPEMFDSVLNSRPLFLGQVGVYVIDLESSVPLRC
jgi:hypothetical protein